MSGYRVPSKLSLRHRRFLQDPNSPSKNNSSTRSEEKSVILAGSIRKPFADFANIPTATTTAPGVLSDCRTPKSVMESTHCDHIPPGELSLMTDDLTTDSTQYFTAPEDGSDVEDLYLRFSAANMMDTGSSKKNILFSGKKSRRSQLLGSKPVLASDSDEDEDIGVRKRLSFNRRKSVLGSHNVILISSESDDEGEEDEKENNRYFNSETPKKATGLSESRMEKVEDWLATSPIPQSPATPARIMVSDDESDPPSDSSSGSDYDGYRRYRHEKTQDIPSSEYTSGGFLAAEEEQQRNTFVPSSFLSECTSKGLCTPSSASASTMETVEEEAEDDDDTVYYVKSVAVQVELESDSETESSDYSAGKNKERGDQVSLSSDEEATQKLRLSLSPSSDPSSHNVSEADSTPPYKSRFSTHRDSEVKSPLQEPRFSSNKNSEIKSPSQGSRFFTHREVRSPLQESRLSAPKNNSPLRKSRFSPHTDSPYWHSGLSYHKDTEIKSPFHNGSENKASPQKEQISSNRASDLKKQPRRSELSSDDDSDSEFKAFVASIRKKYDFGIKEIEEKEKRTQKDLDKFIVDDDAEVSDESESEPENDDRGIEISEDESNENTINISDSEDSESKNDEEDDEDSFSKLIERPLGTKFRTEESPLKDLPKTARKEVVVISSDEDELPSPPARSSDFAYAPPYPDHIATPKQPKKPEHSLKEKHQHVQPIRATPRGENKTLSFLQSLTQDVPIHRRHPDAIKYTNKFNTHKEELAYRLYKYFNEEAFEGLLPSDMEISWNPRLRKTAGICNQKCRYAGKDRTKILDRSSRIELSTKVIDSGDRLRDTLIHEMCHAAAWVISGYRDGHGPIWKSWARRAMNRFPELPIIDRCHNYEIRTKYTYRCMKCGYSIGRHSKSLDTERKCCGYCRGRFELLVNYKNGTGKETPSKTPKTPNAFALFVKGNYKNFKTPGVSHGDIMRVLSKKFADAKIKN